jgi:hypothetical protein
MPALAPVTTATRPDAEGVVICPTLVGVLSSLCVPELLLSPRDLPRLTDPGEHSSVESEGVAKTTDDFKQRTFS